MSPDAKALLQHYPRIFLACHREHVHDPDTGQTLSARQASILDHLDAVEPTAMATLAGHLGVTPATMSIAIDRLERAGYVTRGNDREDGRRVLVRLTQTGVRIREANSVLDPVLVERLVKSIPAAERRAALKGLAILARAADALNAEGRWKTGRRSS